MTHDAPLHTPLPPRPLTLFAYTVEPLAPVYRAVMRLFLEEKERYRIQLRPDEVARALPDRLPESELPDRASLERALDKLVEWGNLRRSHDTGRVATLEDFRRRHYLYQMTPAGEAAERAVGRVVEALESSGSLQRVMLGAILRNLEALAAEMERSEPRPETLYEHLFTAAEQFRALTENASTFLARLHEAIDAGEVDASSFLIYKQAVLEYLEQFVGELSEVAPRISTALRRIDEGREMRGGEAEATAGGDADGARRMVELAARADTTPTPEGLRDRSAELARQWRGMVAWFLGEGREPPTVELLRGAARTAINRILLVLERLHEKRFRRVNRTADLVRLAAWFEDLGSRDGGGAEAHRLFTTAFGLFGARHLGERHEDPERIPPTTSWWDAPPVPVAPVLRKTGRTSTLGRTARVVDHRKARRFLAERHRRDRAARAAALRRFAGRGPIPLAELTRDEPLSGDELDLLLRLLDRLLALPPGRDGARRSRSRDGLLELRLEAPQPDGARAVLRTPAGRLDLPAFRLSVEDRTAGTGGTVDGAAVRSTEATRTGSAP
ncbi:MAG: TIGR02677 family protein [Acidobacteriota bacterium]|jgi:uncharacterized protein (TIGR02677 family)